MDWDFGLSPNPQEDHELKSQRGGKRSNQSPARKLHKKFVLSPPQEGENFSPSPSGGGRPDRGRDH